MWRDAGIAERRFCVGRRTGWCWTGLLILHAGWCACAVELALVPGGRFGMGDRSGLGAADERPAHHLYVRAFWMDRYEVSNAEMCRVLQWAMEEGLVVAGRTSVSNAQGQSQELVDLDDWNCEIQFAEGRFQPLAGRDAFPCVEVTWYGALAYANYRSAMEDLETCIEFATWQCDFTRNGYRLPTEAEWEKAARGNLVGQHFPWFTGAKSVANRASGDKANYWGSGDPFDADETLGTTPVGYYNGTQQPAGIDMANGYGLYDMAGNVYEWCWDFFDPEWYGRAAAKSPDTTGPRLGYGRVVRGGSWLSGSREGGEGGGDTFGPTYGLRCANRVVCDPANGRHNRGFRCVRRDDVEERVREGE